MNGGNLRLDDISDSNHWPPSIDSGDTAFWKPTGSNVDGGVRQVIRTLRTSRVT